MSRSSFKIPTSSRTAQILNLLSLWYRYICIHKHHIMNTIVLLTNLLIYLLYIKYIIHFNPHSILTYIDKNCSMHAHNYIVIVVCMRCFLFCFLFFSTRKQFLNRFSRKIIDMNKMRKGNFSQIDVIIVN